MYNSIGMYFIKKNKGLRRAKHDTNAVYHQVKAEQVYIKSKCKHRILHNTVNCWTNRVTIPQINTNLYSILRIIVF
jgi:hypothetical protein